MPEVKANLDDPRDNSVLSVNEHKKVAGTIWMSLSGVDVRGQSGNFKAFRVKIVLMSKKRRRVNVDDRGHRPHRAPLCTLLQADDV